MAGITGSKFIKMNILYFFPEYDTPMFQWQRVHFISELSRHGVFFETFNPLVYSCPEEANEVFVKRIRKGGFDLLLSGVCYESIIFPEVLQSANQQGIPSLLISWDNLSVPIYDKKQARLFDLVWLTCRDTSYLYDRWGTKYIIQPYAANPYYFLYNGGSICWRVCFLGTPYGSRSLMINTLTRSEVDVDLYFGGSKNQQEPRIDVNYNIPHPNYYKILLHRMTYPEGRRIIMGALKNKLFGSQTIQENSTLQHFASVPFSGISSIYSSYAVCLASTSTNHTDSLKNPLKIVNLRSFEIPMSGGLALCKYNPELAEYFDDGKEILFYHSDQELIEKASFYSKKVEESELRRMKMAARMRAENDHTWWNRFTKVFDELRLQYK